MELDQFQVPYDPSSQHQLHWEPGSYGKGIMSRDGTLHTWNTWREDGDPNHRRYMMESPSFNYDPYQPGFRGNDDHMYFWVDPNGNLFLLNREGDKDAVQRIQQIDPRLHREGPDANWNFTAGIDHQQRAMPDFETQKQMYREDPIAAETQLEWDRYIGQGDTHNHPDVEWVPTHALKPFMEYDRRPGQPDSASSPERWRALKDHIRQNGFNNPVILEYNPDTGTAHMGEGNHRTGIAHELGLPAMPVRINRSRRTSPTQIPVKIQERPEWRNHLGEQHVPASLKPSHLGLPTVPPPDQGWQLS
jgi:hypothetical protein